MGRLVEYFKQIRIAHGVDDYAPVKGSLGSFIEIKHEPDIEKRKTASAEVQKMEKDYFVPATSDQHQIKQNIQSLKKDAATAGDSDDETARDDDKSIGPV